MSESLDELLAALEGFSAVADFYDLATSKKTDDEIISVGHWFDPAHGLPKEFSGAVKYRLGDFRRLRAAIETAKKAKAKT